MRLNSLGRRIAAATVAAAAATGIGLPTAVAAPPARTTSAAPAAPPAVSQLPGASADGKVVVTDSPHVTVTVAPHSASDEQVRLTVTNNNDHQFRCVAQAASAEVSKPKEAPNVVTTADIVAKSVDYYRAKPYVPQDGVAVPVLGVLPLDGFLQFVPEGSSSLLLGRDVNTRADLFRQWDKARLAGHTAEVQPFDLEPAGSKDITVALDAPAHGPRTDFAAAALLYCTDTVDNTAYVFAGYEPGAAPATRPGLGSSSAQGSSGLGSSLITL